MMRHRHLNHSNYSLAAIDDVIARGSREDWRELRDACRDHEVIRAKVAKVCAAYASDRFAQRHFLWALYAKHKTT
jgi:hypothetical protein